MYSFKSFEPFVPEGINWIPLEPPGRGKRAREPLVKDLYTISADLFRQLRGQLDSPYMIYGHSMGGLLAYLVTLRIAASDLPAPRQLFVSGCGGPSSATQRVGRYRLPGEQFWKTLRDLGGSPDEILYDRDLQLFFEPILRADFEAIENYQYRHCTPFDIPITVLIGRDEFVTRKEALLWQKETRAPIEVISYPGNHFFIFEQARHIVHLMAQSINLVNV